MHFDLTDLRLFLAVTNAGSITHGAAEVGLSLSAASERIRDMESAGQVRLFERGRSGVSPTKAGDTLAHHARLVLRQMAQMRGELGEHAMAVRETVRILSNTAALTGLLPGRLARWMAAHPSIDVELKERQSIEIAKGVSNGLAEIGILSDAVDTRGLTLRPFAIDRLVVVVSHDLDLATNKHIFFADMVGRPYVGLTGGALQDHIEAKAAAIGAKLHTRVRVRTFEGICDMAAAGVGFGIVPWAAARRYRLSGRIASPRLADRWASRRLAVCTRAEEELTPSARALLEHLAPEGSG